MTLNGKKIIKKLWQKKWSGWTADYGRVLHGVQ